MRKYNSIRKTSAIVLWAVTLILWGTAAAAQRIWKPDTTTTFEVGTQIRSWTMVDEGIPTILDNMQMAGVNNVYMVVVPHTEPRPIAKGQPGIVFPHNPAREKLKNSDSRVSFFPEWERYGEIKPIPETMDDLDKTDWLKVIIDSVRGRGMAIGAEVSHYFIPKEIVDANPDYQQRNKDGSQLRKATPCPNSPKVQEYAVALYGDLAKNYDLDYVQTCQYLFWRNKMCYCTHCQAEAARLGMDLDNDVDMENFRRVCTNKFFRLIVEEIDRVKKNPKCHLRYNDTYPNRGWDPKEFGVYIDDLAQYYGSLVNQDHREETGYNWPNENLFYVKHEKENALWDWRKQWIATNRELVGPDMTLITGIAPRLFATPEIVKEGIKVAVQHPAKVNGLALKHYDGASYGLLRAFKQGMIEAGVQGLTPTIGLEVEDMALNGFEKVLDWRNDRGAKTTGTGTATATFDGPSNDYNIRISYFEHSGGKSPVTLSINGEEKISFTLDEDVKHNCWRWRVFKDIRVNNGDEIKLVAQADGNEDPVMEFIEFMPQQK